jgi:hypothetical protein
MKRTFNENENNDLFLASNNNIGLIEDLDAFALVAKSTAETQLGEVFYNTNIGVNTFDTLWSGSPDLQKFERSITQNLLGIEGVLTTDDFEMKTVDDVATYSITIKTNFGDAIADFEVNNGGL